MIQRLRNQINSIFYGKEEVVENVLICLLAGGHVLLEDVPGVGKTTLVRTVASSVDLSFGRIQFTPDTLPGDVIGMNVYNMKTQEFEYKQGPIMHQLILADEINRTSPKTQACLLEAMAEGQVTVDGVIYKLQEPFMVLATQNPVEYVGTYPLLEAQMDRFMMKLSVGYPDAQAEMEMLKAKLAEKHGENLTAVCTAKDILELKEQVKSVYESDGIIAYIQEIIELTREEKRIVLGASPRAMIALALAARAKAFLSGRDFVTPDDVKAVAVNVLHHRMSLTSEAKIRKENIDKIVKELVLKAKVPME